jgi:D-threo-aldose 1-dehydrogenase
MRWPPEQRWVEKARRIRVVCEEFGVPLQAAAMQFPFAHPVVAAVLTGAETPAELDANAAYMHQPIPAELWTALKSEDLVHPDAPVPS